MAHPTQREEPRSATPHREGPTPTRYLALALWLAGVGFCAQFAVASAQELEPQASLLGWTLVGILLAGGMAVWAATTNGRPGNPD